MKTIIPGILTLTAVLLLISCPTAYADEGDAPESKWSGVDETVVERFAEAAGRPARDPYINVGEGDMLLFCFLIGGALGGFLFGYCFRMLFHETGRAPVTTPEIVGSNAG